MRDVTPGEIARIRLRNQGLSGVRFASVERAVRSLGAVQSQDYQGAKWGLAQRVDGATNDGLDEAFDDGRILRTHVMRPTWHFVAPGDIRWLLALTAERVHVASGYQYRRFELHATDFERSNRLIADALRGGNHLTRRELAVALERGGVQSSGLRLGYLIMRAELDGIICSGPLRGRQFTYALLEERVPAAAPFERERALAELAGRFFASHGPATVRDFAWWSGLTMRNSRSAVDLLRDELTELDVEGTTYWMADSNRSTDALDPPQPTIHLLPNYDEHVIGYRDRAPLHDPAVPLPLPPDSEALMAHIIVRDGRVVGGWRRTVERDRVVVSLSLLATLSAAEHRALMDAAAAYGRFLGRPAVVTDRGQASATLNHR